MTRRLSLFARVLFSLIAGAALVTGTPVRADAQSRPAPRLVWGIEIDGGLAFGATTPGGSGASSYPPTTTFTTANGQPSRAVSSWMFGDGAVLFGQVQTQFASNFGQNFPAIVPLDDVLRSPSLHRSGVASSIAFRLVRQLPADRYSLEFGIERRGSGLAPTSRAQAALDATRASFEAAFKGLLATVPQNNASVTTSLETASASGGQTMFTAAVRMTIMRHGRLEAHAIAGGGMAFNRHATIDVSVSGTYTFSLLGAYPFNETDKIVVHFVDSGKTPVGILGGGIECALGRRQAVRVDLRLSLSGASFTTSIDASPNARPVSPGAVLPSMTSPSIQFSSVPAIPTSLSGPALRQLPTFTGHGVEARTQLTAGYLIRF